MGGTDKRHPEMGDCKVYRYADWVTAKKPARAWVLCGDGYFYWASVLKPGESTGLLLNQVDAVFDDYSYYYAINVVLEMVSSSDLNTWYEGGTSSQGHVFEAVTDDAKAVLKNAQG